MSLVKLQGNAGGTGTFTVTTPSSNNTQTLTLPDATTTLVGTDTTDTLTNKTLTTPTIATIKSASTSPTVFQNSGGTEIGTLCRAWVNFDGTTGTIRASFNVSSITRTGTGNYIVNYTNALADANYAAVVTGRRSASDSNYCMQFRGSTITGGALYSTTQTAVTGILANSNTLTDADIVGFSAFR